jgi:hypothetical protein
MNTHGKSKAIMLRFLDVGDLGLAVLNKLQNSYSYVDAEGVRSRGCGSAAEEKWD